MRRKISTRLLIVPVALLALLLVGTTLGAAWHHHTGSSDATCQICHVTHQPIERPLAADRTPAFAVLGATPEPSDAEIAPTPVISRIPARAPPLS